MILNKKKLASVLFFYLYFALFSCLTLFGQYRFDTWTTDTGLPQNGIRRITQTPDGYLWFTTFDGLVRFDGVRFTTFNKSNTKGIINNRFTEIYSDTDGTVFAATMEGGVLTVYRKGSFSSFTSEQTPGQYIKKIKPDSEGKIRFLAENDDRETESWYYLENNQFVLSEKRNKDRNTIEYRGKSGTRWTVSPTEIIENRNGNRIVHSYQIKGFKFIQEVFEDSKGSLWIGGVNLFLLENGKIKKFAEKEGFPVNADFHSFWEESDGSVWFANGGRLAPGAGLVRYRDERFSIFGTESGLSDTSVFDVFKDREETIWLATNKGLNRLKKKIINAYSVKDGLDNTEAYPIYRDSKDNIWVGTIKGLNLYRDGKFERVLLQPSRQDVPKHTIWRNGEVSVQSLMEDRHGKMWIGVAGGVFVADNGKTEMLKQSEAHHVSAILEDKNGKVWVTSDKGILLFQDYQLKTAYTIKDGLPHDFMTVIHEDSRGRLWFGGMGGLSEFKDGKFINHTKNEGLTGNYVRSIYEDAQGTLWIGTYDEGLSRFKNGSFVNFKTEDGLFNNGVFAIQEDRSGYFWISSNRGIYRVKRQDLNDFAEGKIEKINSVGYGKEDGMLNSECNGGRQPASIQDKDGKFWFPTQDGVIVIDSELESENSLPPSVVIESVTVERKQIDFRGGITIEPGQKNIEISYTGLSLIKSGQIKFKYKLEGHDPDWIDAGTKRTAYYSYLPPGHYKFLVKAANSNAVWNETGANIELELKPFFYQTKSFYLICVLGAVLLFFVIWMISVQQLRSRERLLTRLVTEKTRELKKANENLLHLANHDALTQIANRRCFEEFLSNEWNRAVRAKSEISIILLDIDHFKLFNDTYGHQSGDECLRRVAAALTETINRPTDLVARFGGEEFALILGGTDAEGAFNIAEQSLENIRKLEILHSTSYTSNHLTVSLGVATVLAAFNTNEADLINAADKAMYQAKELGRNRIFTFDYHTQPPKNADIINQDHILIN